MDIQWPLVFFTTLTGCGGWLAASMAFDEFAKKTKETNMLSAIVAVCLLALGGIASVLHLAHPENMLNALNHPTSGIFIEAVLVGLSAVCLILYIILVKREVSSGACRVFAVAGAFFGVLLSFMAGESYMMGAVPAWDTILLPIGYLCTSIPSGIGLYLLIAGLKKEKNIDSYCVALVIGACIAVVGSLVYAIGCGAALAENSLIAIIVSVVASAISAVCGILSRKDVSKVIPLSAVAVISAIVASLAFRILMWLLYNPLGDFFFNL